MPGRSLSASQALKCRQPCVSTALGMTTRDRALLVVDEAYIEFASQRSLAAQAGRPDNLVVLRTLSKAHGLAGIRIGTAIAAPELIALLKRIMAPYPLPEPSIDAAMIPREPSPSIARTAATGGALAVPISLSITRPAEASRVDRSGMNQAGDRLLFAEGAVGWTVKTWLLLQASARVLWTDQPRLNTPAMVQAAGTLSVTVQQHDSLAW